MTRKALIIAGVTQSLTAGLVDAAEVEVGIDLSSRPTETGYWPLDADPAQEAPETRLKPWQQTHPTSPKPSRNRPMKKGKRK